MKADPVDVCMLTTAFPRFRGDLFGTFVFELARELVRQGVSVHVVAPHDHRRPLREILDGVRVTRFRYMIPSSWQRLAYGGGIPTNLKRSWWARLQVPLFVLSFWWHAFRAASSCRLFHCHWTVSALVARFARLGRSRPVVLSVRGSDLTLFRTGVPGAIGRAIYSWTDFIMPVSADLNRTLLSEGVSPAKLEIVSNGVDGRFNPSNRNQARRKLGLDVDRKIVLYVGLLVPVKGLRVLFDALEVLEDPRLLCVLVGDGQLRDELSARAEVTPLSGRVFFAGARSSEDIPVWMNACDLLVLPSLSEGRPNVVLEAQACGLPVIATRVGGTPELIEDGVDGILVEAGDSCALAESIKQLCDEEGLKNELGAAARRKVEESGLTWEQTASRTQAVYERAAGGN